MDNGLGSASEGRELVEIESARLRTLHLSHLRVDLHSSAEERQARLTRALREIESSTKELEKTISVYDQVARELPALAGVERVLRVGYWPPCK